MTQQLTRHDVEDDLADRLAKSLQRSGISVQRMATLLECHRNTVGGWLNRRNNPYPATLMLWAQYTGVPYKWLKDGKWPRNYKPSSDPD